MVQAGKDAGYNTFRVWGGGIYNPDVRPRGRLCY